MKINNKETLIITTGATAQKVVDFLYSNNPELNYINLGKEKLTIVTSETKTIWFGNLKYQQSEFDIEDYKKILLNRTSKFNEIISKYKNIIIVSYIGEKFGSETLLEVINHLNTLNKEHNVFIIKPSESDGYNTCDFVAKSLEKLGELKYTPGKDLFIYDNFEIVKTNRESVRDTIRLDYKKASEILTMIIESKV